MTFFIKTFGCQMNVNDSEKIRHLLEEKGLTAAGEAEADLIIVNSCAVRAKPQEKIFSYIGRFAGERKVIIAGCVAQEEKEALFAKKVRVDYVVGTHQFYRIGEIVDEIQAPGKGAGRRNLQPPLAGAGAERRSPQQHRHRLYFHHGRLRQFLLLLHCPLHPRPREAPAHDRHPA